MLRLIELLARMVMSIFEIKVTQSVRIVMLQHQLAIYRRKIPKPKIRNFDKVSLMLISKINKFWRSDLIVVKPETLLQWHRDIAKLIWSWKSRAGRKRIPLEIRKFIKRLLCDNQLWGAKRVYDELCLLGYKDKICLTTVKNYIRRLGPRPENKRSNQTWTTFLKNHLSCTASGDFFSVTMLNFKTIYGFVILSHDKRKIIHLNVTESPNLNWLKQQIRNAFYDTPLPEYFVHDRDGIYGLWFKDFIESYGIKDKRTSFKSPWQNCYCERVIGSIRRECLDHVFIFNEDHLRKVLTEYVDYYNNVRPHRSRNGNSPKGRTVQNEKDGNITSVPVLNGLYHQYFRKAA